ncbi:flavin monoamine oxidase family protein [Tenacibaculum amylolyticum]|uniref:flavin monoamine oxidase family protein n=1 Tax=Tenacibaculum amylolyticum TaxID=104269 RepID=UPI00389579EC
MNKSVIIIGGGLSGLTTAHLLKQKKYNVTIIEANSRLGGRIYTKKSKTGTLEMGATWLWKYNTKLLQLCNQLGIQLFEQCMDGDALFEAMSAHAPQRFQLPKNQEKSYRITNGTQEIISRLCKKFTKDEILLNEKVSAITLNSEIIDVTTNKSSYETDYVIATVPPQLLINSINFSPNLPEQLMNVAKKTHTWMNDSIKFAVAYKTPFWRAQKLSGVGFSNVGPFTELYDHSNAKETTFALMGFMNPNMVKENEDYRKEKIIQQLVKFFGAEATNYITYEDKPWRLDTSISTKSSEYLLPHQNNGHTLYQQSFFNSRLIISGSETSKKFGGYMEGAVERAYEVASMF